MRAWTSVVALPFEDPLATVSATVGSCFGELTPDLRRGPDIAGVFIDSFSSLFRISYNPVACRLIGHFRNTTRDRRKGAA
jgi:hypothetical protein